MHAPLCIWDYAIKKGYFKMYIVVFLFCFVFLNLFLEKQDRACQVLNKNFSIKEMKTDHLPGEGKVAAEKKGKLGNESEKCRSF